MTDAANTSELMRLDDAMFERAALALIAAKKSKHTRRAYAADLDRWMEFCRTTAIDPSAPSISNTTLFRDSLMSSLSNETAHRTIAALSSIYRTLLRTGIVRSNAFHPAVLAWPTASTIGKTKLVTDGVALAMIADAEADKNAPRGARDAAILRLLYDTGLRRMSIGPLTRESFNGTSIRTIVKGAKEVELELPPTSVAALERHLMFVRPSPYLFPGRRGPIDVGTINRIVNNRARAVGSGHIHPHCFRAAFITAGYDAELPEYEIQASAHHSDPTTTRRYDRRARGRMVATQIASFRNGVTKR